MKRLIHIFDSWPSGILSVIILGIILWLTLDSEPVDVDIPVFNGVDKIVHGIMFGGLASAICLDVQRKSWMRLISVWWCVAAFVAASLVGCVVEWLQETMNLGRSFEVADMVADAVGALLFTILARFLFVRYGGIEE